MLHKSTLSLLRCVSFCLLITNYSQAEDPPKFKKVITPDSIRFVQVFSEDRQVGTMLFDNFVLGTNLGSSSDPHVLLKKFSYILNVEAKTASQVKIVLRGYVHEFGSGKAVLIVQTSGKSTLVNLDDAIKAANANTFVRKADSLKTEIKKQAEQQGFSENKPPERSDDYIVEIESTVEKDQPLQTTLLMLVERLPKDEKGGAVLMLDSVDLEVQAIKISN